MRVDSATTTLRYTTKRECPTPPPFSTRAGGAARAYDEGFPLLCPMCGGQMRIIAFITFSADIYKMLEHIGVAPEAPRITPARAPPL